MEEGELPVDEASRGQTTPRKKCVRACLRLVGLLTDLPIAISKDRRECLTSPASEDAIAPVDVDLEVASPQSRELLVDIVLGDEGSQHVIGIRGVDAGSDSQSHVRQVSTDGEAALRRQLRKGNGLTS